MLRKPLLSLFLLTALLAAALVFYSQTSAFAWDEGFHLLTAQLILNGRRPYLDFFFPQTPLNAYWNALWMLLFGDTWRTAHAIAAICTALATLVIADYVRRRFPVAEWRLPGAMAAFFAMGFNQVVFEYGTVGQAYGFGLLTIAGAFRMAVLAVERSGGTIAFLSGLLASGGAASSLLMTMVAPVMLLWILVYNRSGRRVAKFFSFCAGAVIPFLPVLWSYLQKPREVLFTVFQYNYRYREVGWDGTATEHNVEVLTAWISNAQAAFLGALAIAGIYFVARRANWNREHRAEFYLCAWIAAVAGLHISTAHPTFARYYLLIVPFLTILALAGLYWLGSSLGNTTRPIGAVWLASFFFVLSLGKSLYGNRDSFTWPDFEPVARKVDQVTPSGALIWADEHVFFISRRAPPTGMEHENSHKPLGLSPEFLRALHILPRPELEARIRAGTYYTAATCEDSDRIKKLDLPHIYEHSETIGDCEVYWEPAAKH